MDKIKEKEKYNLTSEEGRKNLMEFAENYNKNIDENDPLSRKIGIEEALAICNVEEFIKSKNQVAEIVREALEIGFTIKNFQTNTIYTFTRNKLKKLNYNSIIRMQIENYINFRLNNVRKNVTNSNFENITSFKLNNEIFYFNILTGEELEGEKLKEYLDYINDKTIEELPF